MLQNIYYFMEIYIYIYIKMIYTFKLYNKKFITKV